MRKQIDFRLDDKLFFKVNKLIQISSWTIIFTGIRSKLFHSLESEVTLNLKRSIKNGY